MFYKGFVERGGVYDELRVKMAKQQILPSTIKSIEYFKLQYERYPNSLDELQEKTEEVLFISEPFPDSFKQPKQLYYELDVSGDYYFLFSSGPDGVPFTEDDVLPDITEEEMKNISYRVRGTR